MSTPSSYPRPGGTRPLLTRIGALIVSYALMGSVLFLAAGRID